MFHERNFGLEILQEYSTASTFLIYQSAYQSVSAESTPTIFRSVFPPHLSYQFYVHISSNFQEAKAIHFTQKMDSQQGEKATQAKRKIKKLHVKINMQ